MQIRVTTTLDLSTGDDHAIVKVSSVAKATVPLQLFTPMLQQDACILGTRLCKHAPQLIPLTLSMQGNILFTCHMLGTASVVLHLSSKEVCSLVIEIFICELHFHGLERLCVHYKIDLTNN